MANLNPTENIISTSSPDSITGPPSVLDFRDASLFLFAPESIKNIQNNNQKTETVKILKPLPLKKVKYNSHYSDYKLQFESEGSPESLNELDSTENQVQFYSEKYHQTIDSDQNIALTIHTRNYASNDWIVLVLLLSLASIGWIRFRFAKLFHQTLGSAIFHKEAYSLYQDRNSTSNKVSFALNGVFFINFSLFLFLYLERSKTGIIAYTRIENYLLLLLAMLIFLLAKALLYYLTGSLFNTSKLVSEYVYNSSIFNRVAGVLILPIIILFPFTAESYSSYLILLGVFIFLSTYSLQLFRGFQIIFRNNSSVLYTFLYLCSIEILPILVAFKWVSSQI